MGRFDHHKYRPAPAVPLENRQWPANSVTTAPVWASVDLRDGNQALLEPMTVAQKQQLWALLVKVGFKQIEIGFPSASQQDFDFVRWLIDEQQIPADVTVQVLVPAREALIERTFEALSGVKQAIVHLYNSTSTVQRERVFATDRAGVQAIAVQGAQWVAREATRYPATRWTFQYSPESFSNTEPDFAVEVCNAVASVWAPTPKQRCIMNLPATVESSSPNVFADQVEYFCRHIDDRESIVVSVHTHNDRGCAVAAAELAMLAGADRVEGTLLGNGERTGNMDVLTMAMNLYSQGIDPELDLSAPDEIIRVYSDCTGLPVHPRHPWVGELVYTAFSGSHQDAIRKCLARQQDEEPWQVAYLPIDPADIGRDYEAVIRVNSQSGKGGVGYLLERDYGLALPRWLLTRVAAVVQAETERRSSELSSAEIHQLLIADFGRDTAPLSLNGYTVRREDNREFIEAQLSTARGQATIEGQGAGAIEAFVSAWSGWLGRNITVREYNEHALGEGADAEAVAYVLLEVDGESVAGVARDRDTLSASLKALLAAVNPLEARRLAAA